MDIGIGIPNTIPSATGDGLLEWARRAEDAGFSTLATIGAVAYKNYEELTVLGAAAAVTDRIGLLTNILVAPARTTAELAKQSATVDELSGGRLTLGLGVGWRDIDYEVTGRDFHSRGDTFDEQLRDLHSAWAGEPVADTRPVVPQTTQDADIPLLIGGTSEPAMERVAEHGIGWTAGGLPPEAVGEHAQRVREAWNDAGREGEPRIVALVYFGLGDTEEESRSNLLDYYQPQGRENAEMIADSALRSPQAISGAIQGFAEVGVDELILDPTVPDPGQVDQLAEIAL